MKKVITKIKNMPKKLVASFAVIATVLGIAGYAVVNAGETPVHHKSVTPNPDGTYKISLDITGSASTTKTNAKANVLVIYDVSSSMINNNIYNYTATTTSSDSTYGFINGDYVQVTRTWYYQDADGNNVVYDGNYKFSVRTDQDDNPNKYGFFNNAMNRVYWRNGAFRQTANNNGTVYNGTVYERHNTNGDYASNTEYYGVANNSVVSLYSGYQNNGTVYTGTRYTRSNSNITRADAAEKVVYDFADALFKYNEGEGNSNNVEMSLVTFSSYNHCDNNNCTASAGTKTTAAWLELDDGKYWTNTKSDILNQLSSTGNRFFVK